MSTEMAMKILGTDKDVRVPYFAEKMIHMCI